MRPTALAFNVGVRVDIQDGESDLRQAVISSTTVAPRLTASYDIFGNGKTLAYAAYGIYQDFLVQSIIDSIYSGVPQQQNFDLYLWDGEAWQFAQAIRAGGSDQPVNQDLNPSSVDEFNIGFQQQLGNTVALGLRGIYRRWNNLVDDARFIDAGRKFMTPYNFTTRSLHRYYKAIELTSEKRFAKNWQVWRATRSRAPRATRRRSSPRSSSTTTATTCNLPAVTQRDQRATVVDAPAVSGNCAGHPRRTTAAAFSPTTRRSLGEGLRRRTPIRCPIVNLTAAPSFTISSGPALPAAAGRSTSTRTPTSTTTRRKARIALPHLVLAQLRARGRFQNLRAGAVRRSRARSRT